MKHTGLMKALLSLSDIEKLHKSRLTCLSMLMLGIVEARTVNLKSVVLQIQSLAKDASIYRRVQRFFAELEFDSLLFTRLMVSLMAKERYVLCIDRTNWKFGSLHINILMIAVADDGLAIPLAFVLLDKAGNSNTLERVGLLEQVLDAIQVHQIEVFLADREFIGQVWFSYLTQHNIPFAIRIRENSLADEWFRLSHFFSDLDVASTKSLQHRYKVCGCQLAVAAAKGQNAQLVIIVSNFTPSKTRVLNSN